MKKHYLLDFLHKTICLLKLPFLASLSLNFSTICSHMLSKFIKKSAQKASIFSSKANYARSLLMICILPFLMAGCKEEGTFEKAGKKFDESIEEAKEKLEEMQERIEKEKRNSNFRNQQKNYNQPI